MRLQFVLAGLLLVAVVGFFGGAALGSVAMHLDVHPAPEGAQNIATLATQGLADFEGSSRLVAGLLTMIPIGLLYHGLRVRRAALTA